MFGISIHRSQLLNLLSSYYRVPRVPGFWLIATCATCLFVKVKKQNWFDTTHFLMLINNSWTSIMIIMMDWCDRVCIVVFCEFIWIFFVFDVGLSIDNINWLCFLLWCLRPAMICWFCADSMQLGTWYSYHNDLFWDYLDMEFGSQ